MYGRGREINKIYIIFHQSTSSSTMDIAARHDAFVNFTPADFYQNIASGRIEDTQQEETEGEDESLYQRRNHAPVDTPADLANFETVKQVLQVLKEGEMDVAGFLGKSLREISR